MRDIRLEISVDSADAVLAAARGGADRLELCSSLVDGGLTPSIGLVAWAVATVEIPVYCMVRPRAGGFCYSRDELEIMERDIHALKAAGAHGIVCGVLTGERRVDIEATTRLVRAALPLPTVFHRAFDLCRDLPQALEDVIACGAAVLLTSGGRPSLEEGSAVVRELCALTRGRIQMMGGAGVRAQNAARLWKEIPVDTLHASLRTPREHDGVGEMTISARENETLYTVREQDVREVAALLQPRSR